MNIQTLNWWAVVVAAVSAFLIGGLWYSVLFAGVWKRANGFGENQPSANPAKAFGISFVLALVMAFNLAMFLNDPKTNFTWGATAGFLAGFGWGAMGIGIVSLFENRPFSYVLVNGGYMTVALTLMGAMPGAWR